MRFRTFFALLTLVLIAAAAHAQSNTGAPPPPRTAAEASPPGDPTARQEYYDGFIREPAATPTGRFFTPTIANPEFPLRVYLRVGRNNWVVEYMTYSGSGQLSLADTSTQQYDFRYGCHYTFAPGKEPFQAKWQDAGHRKLQVLLDDPHNHTTHTCTLSTKPMAVTAASTHP